jgi:hypothetical protein
MMYIKIAGLPSIRCNLAQFDTDFSVSHGVIATLSTPSRWFANRS